MFCGAASKLELTTGREPGLETPTPGQPASAGRSGEEAREAAWAALRSTAPVPRTGWRPAWTDATSRPQRLPWKETRAAQARRRARAGLRLVRVCLPGDAPAMHAAKFGSAFAPRALQPPPPVSGAACAAPLGLCRRSAAPAGVSVQSQAARRDQVRGCMLQRARTTWERPRCSTRRAPQAAHSRQVQSPAASEFTAPTKLVTGPGGNHQ